MEDTHIKKLKVSGFKKFTDLEVDNIGQFNLIIGDNNVGKTSLLEVLTADDNYKNFFNSLGTINFGVRKFEKLSYSFINLYFNDFSLEYPKEFNIKLETENNSPISINFVAKNSNDFFLENIPLEDSNLFPLNNSDYENQPFNINIPFIPMGSLYTHELTNLYSRSIQLFVDKKDKLINAVSYLIPKIKNIEVNAYISHSPILLISEDGKNNLSPLASYGDGALKLFRIALSLFSNNHYDRLMIDEIDTGIHYSRQNEFFKSLINVSVDEKKQIFATTHSKECIENFVKALDETGMQNRGRIIRLANTKQGIKAFTMEFAEFENAILAESEIR